MTAISLDAGELRSPWCAIAPGNSRLTISREDAHDNLTTRFDVELPGGLAFVVARCVISLELPDEYSFHLSMRAHAPRMGLEFKLVDASGLNVWRYRKPDFDCTDQWHTLVIADRDIEFAWGPQRADQPRRIAALEIALLAEVPVRGTYWLRELTLHDDTYCATPLVTASSAQAAYPPSAILTAAPTSAWHSASGSRQFITLDFKVARRFNALEIVWARQLRPHSFMVRLSHDGRHWRTVYTVSAPPGARSYCFVPESQARYLRVDLACAADQPGVGIQHLDIKPPTFARSLDSFFESIAAESLPGTYPKTLYGRQSYWTLVGTPTPTERALINAEGMVEIGDGACSIEPFIYTNEKLVTWADVALEQQLAEDYLPLPAVLWRTAEFTLTTAVCVLPQAAACDLLYVRYTLENLTASPQMLCFFAAIRPFQVTPVWQRFNTYGGCAPLTTLAYDGHSVRLNEARTVIPITAPTSFGAVAFDQGDVLDFLAQGSVPPHTHVHDSFAHASGALAYALTLAPGERRIISLVIPLARAGLACLDTNFSFLSCAAAFTAAARDWSSVLEACNICLPPGASALTATMKTAAAQILINRQPPWLHPGPRRYARAYLRDGVIMGAALARVGQFAPLRDFMRAYCEFQTPDGGLPDCIDTQGAEFLPEFDAYGEFIFGVMEYVRLSGDTSVLAEFAEPVARALAYLERLRAQRLTPEYAAPAKRLYYGLLPESMSHEGYMAHPVHAYWDDFWALRGIRDAADLATLRGEHAEAARRTRLGDSFADDLAASIEACLDHHRIEFLPGAAELGDFDPAASALAFTIADAEALLPAAAVRSTFDRYLAGLRERTAGTVSWGNYSAYEVRIVQALVRLGRRAEALELLHTLLADRRPRAWNQWPEQSWRDLDAPGFLGDLPHSWIGAEYLLAALSLFAYERASDQALVLAAGVDPAWLAAGFEISVAGLVTHYGRVSYRLQQSREAVLTLSLRGVLTMPAGGIVIQAPLPRALREVTVNGHHLVNFTADTCTVREWPAEIRLSC